MGNRQAKLYHSLYKSKVEEDKKDTMYRSIILDKSAEQALELNHLQKTIRNNSDTIYRLEQNLDKLEDRLDEVIIRLDRIEFQKVNESPKKTSNKKNKINDDEVTPLKKRSKFNSIKKEENVEHIIEFPPTANIRTRLQIARDEMKRNKSKY